MSRPTTMAHVAILLGFVTLTYAVPVAHAQRRPRPMPMMMRPMTAPRLFMAPVRGNPMRMMGRPMTTPRFFMSPVRGNRTVPFFPPQVSFLNRRDPFARFEARFRRADRLGLRNGNPYGMSAGNAGTYGGSSSSGGGTVSVPSSPVAYATPNGDDSTPTGSLTYAEELAIRRRVFDEYLYERGPNVSPSGETPSDNARR